MKILLLGKNGQIGWELQRSLALLGEIVAPDRNDSTLCGDLTHYEALAKTVRTVRPNLIVNAAAYTAVDRAESDAIQAHNVNARAPGILATEARGIGAILVHYSSDYVFDGSGDQPWREEDPTEPLSVYGRTKLAGEQAIRDSGCAHLIFRSSWVYAAHGNNFAKTVLALAAERETLSVVNDQFGAPTGADLIADITAHAVRSLQRRPSLAGTYHVAASGCASWYDYAAFIFQQTERAGRAFRLKTLNAVSASEYPAVAKRPANSRLSTERFQEAFGLSLPLWQYGVVRMLDEVFVKTGID